jgi:hypothetical protein
VPNRVWACINKGSKTNPQQGPKATGNAKYTQAGWEKRRLSSLREEVR